MFQLRACPRCQGDLFLERNDLDDEEIFCVRCGFRRFQQPVDFKGLVWPTQTRDGSMARQAV